MLHNMDKPAPAVELLTKDFNVSRETLRALEEFVLLLEKWNSSINLIGKSTLDKIWQRHVLDSAQLLRYIPSKQPLVITDFGSGAGFPGIILGIISNHTIHLIESDKRKAAFLQQASMIVPGKIFVHNKRIEAISPWKSDIIMARALAPLDQLLTFAEPFCTESSSCLFLKGVKLEEELSLCKHYWKIDVSLHPSITSENASVVELRNIKRVDS